MTVLMEVNMEQQFETVVENVVKTLVPGEKYTLVFTSDFGIGASVVHFKHVKAENKRYAQYPTALHLVFLPPKKRVNRGKTFTPNDDIVIYKGFVNIDNNAFGPRELSSSGCVVRKSKYSCFDSRYLSDALESTSEKPLVKWTGILRSRD